MTTFDATLIHDETDRLVFRDWLLEGGNWTEETLLRFVLQVPGNDHFRLLYALWCRENGQEDRGEFIEVQLDLAKTDDELVPAVLGERLYHLQVRTDARRLVLRRRERELWRHIRRLLPEALDADLTLELGASYVRSPLGLVQSGFVSRIELPTQAFLDHAGAIFMAQPVESVRLVDREPYEAGTSPDRWTWFPDYPVNWQDNPAYLPRELYERLKGREYKQTRSSNWREYTEQQDALSDLSQACVSLGRTRAGLPPLPPAESRE